MRIGIDGRLWNETGVGRYIRSLFKYLPRDQEIVWFFGKREFDTLEMPSSNWKKVLANVHWHTLSEQLILPWIFAKENLDLLHFPYFSFPILYSGKFVVTIHDLIFDHYKTGKWSTLPGWLYTIKKFGYHLINWVSVFRAQKIFTLSQNAKNELISHYRARPDKVVVTYESGDLEDNRRDFYGDKFSQIRSLQPYILYVGNAHPHKNVPMLIKSMKYISDLKLVLIGNDKFFYPQLPANDKVIVIGEVPNNEIAAWYHFAAALVTASKMEGFGIPPLEAMSQGCPVIVSDIPVFHEVYANAAIYFDQNDPKDIAYVINKTIADKKLLTQQIILGHQQVKKYSWKKMTQETISIYESSFGLRSDQ